MKTVIKFAQCFYFLNVHSCSYHLYSGFYFHYYIEATFGIEISFTRKALSSPPFQLHSVFIAHFKCHFFPWIQLKEHSNTCHAQQSRIICTFNLFEFNQSWKHLGRKIAKNYFLPPVKVFLKQHGCQKQANWFSTKTNSSLLQCWRKN